MRLFVLCLHFLFLVFSLHVSGLHGPIIRDISSCCSYATIWFMQCFAVLCWSSACVSGLVCGGPLTHEDDQQSTAWTKWQHKNNSLKYPWWWAHEGLWWWLHHHKPVRWSTQTINKALYEPNGSIKQQLEIPLMMGPWRPQTCREKTRKRK